MTLKTSWAIVAVALLSVLPTLAVNPPWVKDGNIPPATVTDAQKWIRIEGSNLTCVGKVENYNCVDAENEGTNPCVSSYDKYTWVTDGTKVSGGGFNDTNILVRWDTPGVKSVRVTHDSFARDSYTNFIPAFNGQTANISVTNLKVDLDIGTVPDADEETVGGFVPVNADNDNGSTVTPYHIPAKRDFDADNYTDNDLVAITLNLEPTTGLSGTLRLRKVEGGRDRIKVWETTGKATEVALPKSWTVGTDTIPATLYVEGLKEGEALRAVDLVLEYLQGGTVLCDDKVKATVTPVITAFDIATGNVSFKVGSNGLGGLRSTGPGASYDATVTRTGCAGDVVFVQNINALNNGLGGAANAYVFTTASGFGNIGLGIGANNTFPVLDRLNIPPPPDYDVAFARPVNNSTTQQITANDSPDLNTVQNAAFLKTIDTGMEFTMFVVWRFPDGILRTLATRDWHVVFRADTYAPNQGVTRIDAASGVFSPNPFVRSNTDPVLAAPKFNDIFVFVP